MTSAKTASNWWRVATRWALRLLILALVVGGGAAVALRQSRRDSKGDDSDRPVFAVAEGPLTISVTESGTVKAREQVIIKNEVEGRTTILSLVAEGKKVTKGELLVELDASSLEDGKVDQEIRVENAEAAYIRSRENLAVAKNQALSDVDKAELTLRFAKEDLNQYVDGVYPMDVKKLEAKITLAEEKVQRAAEKVKWSRILFKEKYISQSDLQGDELSEKGAELDLDILRSDLGLLKDFTYHREVTKFESDVKQAEMALERVTRKASADVVQAEADLRAKEAEFGRQKDKLVKIGEQIVKTKILAPTDGLVVYATSAKASFRGNQEPLDEGQEIRERQELIYLPTAYTFMSEVKIHESNLDKVSVGLAARITVDALPGKSFTGRVARIAPLPDAQSMFMNPDLKVYRTEIHVDGESEELRTGMSCRSEILIERYDKAVYVPVQSVLRVGGVPTAFVVAGGQTEVRPIEIGLDNNRMVRVISGLKPGEQVLLAPPLDAAKAMDREMVTTAPVAQKGGSSAAESAPAVGGRMGQAGEGGGRMAQAGEGGGRVGAAGDGSVRVGEAGEGGGRGGRGGSRMGQGGGRTGQGGSERGGGPGRGGDGEGGGRRGSMTPEQLKAMRERYEKMTPEEREAARKQYQGRRQRGQGQQGGGGAGQ